MTGEVALEKEKYTAQKIKALEEKGLMGTVKRVSDNEYYVNIDPEKIRLAAQEAHNNWKMTLVSLFASDERALCQCFALYYAFADRKAGNLFVLRTEIHAEKNEFLSISGEVPAAALYEREIQDFFGLVPVGHPDPKPLVFHENWPEGCFPLRKEFEKSFRPSFADREIGFARVEGEGIYEIPVGPVHAGIIEPGHFRFSVAGEPIINLEARLGYVHKGIEKLCEGESIEKGLHFSERISGDESFSHSLAYCQAVEKIAGISVPYKAQLTRVFFAELERLVSHLGDLGGVCLDAAYGFATFQYRMLRGWSYRIAAETCGMRFLRSVNQPGGVRKDFLKGREASVLLQLEKIRKELSETTDLVRSNTLYADRIENTGILKQQTAKDLNAVGPGGRGSGVECDVRKHFPYCSYDKLDFETIKKKNGDISSRLQVKSLECMESLKLMETVLHELRDLPEGNIREEIGILPAYGFAFGMNEGAKGENIHWLMAGENNTIFRYKVRTPSFCNWPALCHAVRGNLVPDFPLINKSFNLSYAGNDL